MRKTLLFSALFLIVGCATSKKLNRLSIGMTKHEVIRALGDPVSVSSPGNGVEYLNYRFSETGEEAYQGISQPYYVLIVDGYLQEYGRYGEFTQFEQYADYEDNSLTPTEKMEKELKVLKGLLDDGILGQEEYDLKKKEILSRY